jgi:hypothetical protein
LTTPTTGEDDLEGAVWVTGVQGRLYVVDDACVQAVAVQGRLVEYERTQGRPLHGCQEAVRRSARMSEQVGAVARGGEDG